MVISRGYSTFKPHCSKPSNFINFVSSPDTRGTLEIVFSCLFTLFACTWSIQHLNVPEQRVVKRAVDKRQGNRVREEGQRGQTRDRLDRVVFLPGKPNGFWSDLSWTLTGFWSNLKWMLFTIVAPEIILGKAVGDLVSARKVRTGMKALAECDCVEWGLEHSFFAGMGGFVGVEQSNDDQEIIPLSAQQIYELRTTEVGTNRRLTAFDIKVGRAQVQTYIDKLPDITAAEINDKSKGNIFVKIVTLFQVSWVVLQIIVRGVKGLSISLLELSVVAFSACSIVTYLLYKPQGVRTPTRIRCEKGTIEWARKTDSIIPLRLFFIPRSGDEFDDLDREREKRIPNDSLQTDFNVRAHEADYDDRLSLQAGFWGSTLGGAIFGSIHVAGWNLTFPTSIERTLWRVSSVLVTALLPITFLPEIHANNSERFAKCLTNYLFCDSITFRTWIQLLLGIVYVLARLVMVAEIIRTLFYLPPDSFTSTWTASIPHVS